MSNALDTDSKARDVVFLDNYALARWRCVLHFMVGAGAAKGPENEGISPDAVRILLHAQLMKRDETDGSAAITRQGFQFLLLDTQVQVWHFMLQYLDTCEQRGLNLPECLSMLFQLSFSTLGRDYSSEGLSSGLLTFLQHLREFGLVYQRKVRFLIVFFFRLYVYIKMDRKSKIWKNCQKKSRHCLKTFAVTPCIFNFPCFFESLYFM